LTGQADYQSARFKLLMAAHYPKEESKRNESVHALIAFCIEAGDYKFLIKLSKDSQSFHEMQEAAKKSILEAAFKACAIHSTDEPLHNVATMNDISTELRKCATMGLIERYKAEIKTSTMKSGPDDILGVEVKFRRISIDDRYPYDERIVAGLEIVKICRKNEDALGLLFMVAEKRHPRKVIMAAGTALFDICVKSGEYKMLEDMQPEMLPLDLRFLLEDKIAAARKRAEDLKIVLSERGTEDARLDPRLLSKTPAGSEGDGQIESERLATHEAWTPDLTYRKNFPPAPKALSTDPRERPTLKTPYSKGKPPVPR